MTLAITFDPEVNPEVSDVIPQCNGWGRMTAAMYRLVPCQPPVYCDTLPATRLDFHGTIEVEIQHEGTSACRRSTKAGIGIDFPGHYPQVTVA